MDVGFQVPDLDSLPPLNKILYFRLEDDVNLADTKVVGTIKGDERFEPADHCGC